MLEGVGSARVLDRLTMQHDAYRWICGGVPTNYHALADFRVEHAEALDRILTTSLATLLSEGLVTMERVAQDRIRVRASAGAASFRRRPTLEEGLREAEQQLEALRRELDEDPAATSRRQAAARERACEERKERINQALAQMPAAEARQRDKHKDKAQCRSLKVHGGIPLGRRALPVVARIVAHLDLYVSRLPALAPSLGQEEDSELGVRGRRRRARPLGSSTGRRRD